MMDENLRLLTFQQELEKDVDHKVKFVGMSVSETIKLCLVHGLSKKADRVKKEWSVPDKRFWYIKLQALTQLGDFDGLAQFVKSKKSPIGYEPIVHHLAETGHPKEALAYVPLVDQRKRVDLYAVCGDWQAAGKECVAQKDRGRLECVHPCSSIWVGAC